MQINDSQVFHPVIVFQVNLETLDRQGHLTPSRTETTGNETVAEANNMKNTRSTWTPGFLTGENLNLRHGDQFTLKGQKATYVKNLYVTGDVDSLLSIISET